MRPVEQSRNPCIQCTQRADEIPDICILWTKGRGELSQHKADISFPPPTQTSPIVHASSRPTIELKGGVSWSRITALAESGAEFLEITYSPGAMSGEHMSHHEGREFGLILDGELVVELGFESYTLRGGDSIIFESTTPHRLINKNTQPTRAVWVVLSKP